MEAAEEAAVLIDRHGRHAPQVVVDEIVAAIRRGDDEAATERGMVLRAVDEAIRRTGAMAGGGTKQGV